MHERHLARDLVAEAVKTVESVGAHKALGCVLRCDALAHLEEASFESWWREAAEGSPVADAKIVIERDEDTPGFGVRLVSLEVE